MTSDSTIQVAYSFRLRFPDKAGEAEDVNSGPMVFGGLMPPPQPSPAPQGRKRRPYPAARGPPQQEGSGHLPQGWEQGREGGGARQCCASRNSRSSRLNVVAC
jgi:hypothetical protein